MTRGRMRPRTRTSPCGCTGRCARGSKRTTLWRNCATGWRCGWCRCYRGSSATGCESTSGGSTRRARSSRSGCTRSRRRPTTAPADPSTSGPRSRSRPSSSTSSGCRCGRRPPRASPPRRSRCCRIAFEHELPKLILEHRAMSKLKSTYTDALPALRESRHRAGPYQLPPSGSRHRTPLVLGPEPPEHPRAHRRGPAHPPSVRRRPRIPARCGGLLPDRASDHGAPLRRPGPARRLRIRRGHPPGDRGRGLRGRAGR